GTTGSRSSPWKAIDENHGVTGSVLKPALKASTILCIAGAETPPVLLELPRPTKPLEKRPHRQKAKGHGGQDHGAPPWREGGEIVIRHIEDTGTRGVGSSLRGPSGTQQARQMNGHQRGDRDSRQGCGEALAPHRLTISQNGNAETGRDPERREE